MRLLFIIALSVIVSISACKENKPKASIVNRIYPNPMAVNLASDTPDTTTYTIEQFKERYLSPNNEVVSGNVQGRISLTVPMDKGGQLTPTLISGTDRLSESKKRYFKCTADFTLTNGCSSSTVSTFSATGMGPILII